ncbi:MAG TPA: hypothetical protein VLF90_02330 [Patescibacteria group bacterium]|nr:hypothetical protein [Patescibacteria group bacterium]
MNPTNNHYQPSPNLPAPTPGTSEGTVEHNTSVKAPDAHAETASVAAELPQNSIAPPAPVAPPAYVPAAPPPLPVNSPAQDLATSANSPASADDTDLIEQEWVHKAKAIVDRTREDPHLQNKEINKFKADYIKKRYNREIKVTEE